MNMASLKFIKLAMAIVGLGILLVVIMPRVSDLSGRSKISAVKAGLGTIRSAVAIEYARSAASGAPAFPRAITADLFSDRVIPMNAMNNSARVIIVDSPPSGMDTSGNGWWYIPASGRVGAYSDGTHDTSGW